jgi:hypothetical protein
MGKIPVGMPRYYQRGVGWAKAPMRDSAAFTAVILRRRVSAVSKDVVQRSACSHPSRRARKSAHLRMTAEIASTGSQDDIEPIGPV